MAFEIGERVRVLPGARSVDNDLEDDFYPDVAGDKTGLITGGPDSYGDYDVRDGDGLDWGFAPEFLESLEETPAPEVKVGDKVRVTRDFVVGRNDGWRLVEDTNFYVPLDGTEVEILERAQVAPKVGDFVDPQGEYASGTVAVLDTRTDYVVVKDDEDNSWGGSGVGACNTRDFLPDRWKIIYIPEEGK